MPTNIPLQQGYPQLNTPVIVTTAYPEQLATASAPSRSDLMTRAPTLSGQVTYYSGGDGTNQIYVRVLDTGQHQQLTTTGDNVEPAWSHDGQSIAFACRNDKYYDICVMNADGSNQRHIVQGQFNSWDPSWSPDDTQIVFTSSEVPFAHLYVVDLESGNIRRLLESGGDDAGPHWSAPNGRIIYASQRIVDGSSAFNLFSLLPDGTDEIQLTSFGSDDRPQWSNDGQQIAFQREVVKASTFSGIEVMVMDVATHSIRQLTNNNFPDEWPSFSPDGLWIVYSSRHGDGWQLQVVPTQGGMPAPLITGGLSGSAPDWKP
jgi:TolB protein